MTRDILAHTISLLDRICRTSPTDAMRVAVYVRRYMDQLVEHGALDDDSYKSFTAVLRQWHEAYGLPWVYDATAAFALLFPN